MQKFYVYIICDPRPGKNNVPVYIGKGQRRRAYFHFKGKSCNRPLRHLIAKCHADGHKIESKIIERFATEEEALAAEIALIAKYGRRDLGAGSLLNLTNGGDGTVGYQQDAKTLSILKASLDKIHATPELETARIDALRTSLRERYSDPENVSAQAKRMKERNVNPTFAAKRDKALQKRNASSENSERMRRRNNNPDSEFNKARIAGIRDPNVQAANAERMRKRNDDPAHEEARRAGLRAHNTKPETVAAWQEHLRKLHANTEVQARRIAAIKQYWAARRAEKHAFNVTAAEGI